MSRGSRDGGISAATTGDVPVKQPAFVASSALVASLLAAGLIRATRPVLPALGELPWSWLAQAGLTALILVLILQGRTRLHRER